MPIVTLRDLYVAELQDLLDAEQQILQELPVLAGAATSSDLRRAFEDHLEATGVHAERLHLLLRRLDATHGGAPCEALRGLIREGRRRLADGERGDVLDAALIGTAQRIEHYEMAAYGCARTYARTLGDREAEALLQQTLDEEGRADSRLTKIAERGINAAAGEDVSTDPDRQRARLRYIPGILLRDFRYRGFHIRSTQGDDLGTFDGLIVDSRSLRPEYVVVDAGGWLLGRRYLVPVYELKPDEASNSLRTDLDRKAIAARPPFNADAFSGPSSTTAAQADDDFQPPTWLMTGVWMTEASGFACVPPRAQSDYVADVPQQPATHEEYPENELMTARGEPDDLREPARRDRNVRPRDTEDPKSTEPRIERYRER